VGRHPHLADRHADVNPAGPPYRAPDCGARVPRRHHHHHHHRHDPACCALHHGPRSRSRSRGDEGDGARPYVPANTVNIDRPWPVADVCE
jgi:hypothetical protein